VWKHFSYSRLVHFFYKPMFAQVTLGLGPVTLNLLAAPLFVLCLGTFLISCFLSIYFRLGLGFRGGGFILF